MWSVFKLLAQYSTYSTYFRDSRTSPTLTSSIFSYAMLGAVEPFLCAMLMRFEKSCVGRCFHATYQSRENVRSHDFPQPHDIRAWNKSRAYQLDRRSTTINRSFHVLRRLCFVSRLAETTRQQESMDQQKRSKISCC